MFIVLFDVRPPDPPGAPQTEDVQVGWSTAAYQPLVFPTRAAAELWGLGNADGGRFAVVDLDELDWRDG